MLDKKTIKIGQFINNPEGMEAGTRLTKIIYNEKEMYLAVLYRKHKDFSESIPEIDMLSIIAAVEEHKESCSYKESAMHDHLIFVYDSDNEYINNVLTENDFKSIIEESIIDTEVKIPFWIEDRTTPFDIEMTELKNNLELYLINYLGEEHKVLSSEIDASFEKEYVSVTDNVITINKTSAVEDLGDKLPVLPMDIKYITAIYKIKINGMEPINYNSKLQLNFDYTSKQKENITNSNLDVECLANAIFELDSKLIALGLNSEIISTLNIDGRAINYMAEMWARWIKTGRKNISECPEQYQDEVKAILEIQ